MPFKSFRISVEIPERVVTRHNVQAVNESGLVVVRLELQDQNAKAVEASDASDYSLKNQLNAGNKIKQVNTSILEDNFESITTDMVQPYFENENNEAENN